MDLGTKTYNLLIIFELQKIVRKEEIEFMEILSRYNILAEDTSKQIYKKLCNGQIFKKNKDRK